MTVVGEVKPDIKDLQLRRQRLSRHRVRENSVKMHTAVVLTRRVEQLMEDLEKEKAKDSPDESRLQRLESDLSVATFAVSNCMANKEPGDAGE